MNVTLILVLYLGGVVALVYIFLIADPNSNSLGKGGQVWRASPAIS
jgi:hypothetical protein